MIQTSRLSIMGAVLGRGLCSVGLGAAFGVDNFARLAGAGGRFRRRRGGVAAADNLALHAADTLRAGKGIVDPATAQLVTAEARLHPVPDHTS